MLAFRSLDPFRALREPDRRRRDEERLSRSEQRTLSKTQNNHLTGKAPYKFESGLLQRGVLCEPASSREKAHCASFPALPGLPLISRTAARSSMRRRWRRTKVHAPPSSMTVPKSG